VEWLDTGLLKPTFGPSLFIWNSKCYLHWKCFLLFFSADYGGHGNSFHGSGGRGNKRAQMRYCLRLIRGMVSVGDDGLNQDLVDQGAINQIVGKFSDLDKTGTLLACCRLSVSEPERGWGETPM